jgi:hypothetical protein
VRIGQAGRVAVDSQTLHDALTEAALRRYQRTGETTLLVAAERFRGRLDPLR